MGVGPGESMGVVTLLHTPVERIELTQDVPVGYEGLQNVEISRRVSGEMDVEGGVPPT